MKIIVLVAALSLSVSAARAVSDQIVFEGDYQTLENSRLIYSNDAATGLEFELGGVEIQQAGLSSDGYVVPKPLCSLPERFGQIAEEGLPDLAAYTESIIIPDQVGVRINIISAEYQTIENVNVAPSQPFQIEGDDTPMPFAKDNEAYSINEFYPGDLVTLSEPMIMRDFRFVRSVVYPMQYNPVTKELRIYTHIQYELVFEGFDSRNMKIRRDNNISEAFTPIYKSVFKNADDVLADFDVVRGGYLIISPITYNFDDSIQTLARWKHLKGYYTHVAPTTEITPGGTPSYAQVYSYIQNAYNTWDVPPEFVLLVGDENMQVPDYPYSGYTSDHQYSTVDGTDYISDLLIARMSVDDMNQLLTAMIKVTRYEQNPDMTDPGYYKRGLGVAGNILATSPRIVNLWVRSLAMNQHGFTQVDTVFDWGSGEPSNWSTIPTAINNGVSYVSYRGWAGPSGWYDPSYTRTNIGQLTNGFKLGIMASVVCGTGDFGDSYSDPCFGEAWISYGSTTLPKGGPCFYGSTDHYTHTAWNNPNMVGFFWALFEQDMYHFAQLMFMGKQRIAECFPRYTNTGGYVNRYFNTYNSLGDPALEVRTETPVTISASYPSTIPVGQNNITVNVTADGSPLEGAYVNIVKGWAPSEESYAGDWADASGSATITFANTYADTIHVTVTARDHVPHIGYCMSTAVAVSVGLDQYIIDDDAFGGTIGNEDGNVNPGEYVGLDIQLRNYGNQQAATNVNLILSSDDPRIAIVNPVIPFPDIQPGQIVISMQQPVINLVSNIPHGENIILNAQIDSDQGSWNAFIPLEIISIKPVLAQVNYPGDPNFRLDPGDNNSNLTLSFVNAGGLSGQSIMGILTSNDQYISILNGAAVFGDVAIGQSGSNDDNPFVVSVDPAANHGRNVNFTVHFEAAANIEFEKTFSIVLGSVTTEDPCGPDDYGYYMYDNTDTGYEPHPTYSWVELSPSPGTRLTTRNNDDCSELITLPFDFVYFGQAHRQLIVSINGFVALDTIPYDAGGNYWHNWDNWPQPDPGNARGQISPFWDDLLYSGSTNGIYTYYDSDNGRYIIEWKGFTHATTGSPETFEMIIYDSAVHPTPTGDSEILFQYQVINNDDDDDDYRGPAAYSTVGFENWEQTDGIQYEYDNTYHPAAAVLQSGRAILITTATGSALDVPTLVSPPDGDISDDMTPTLTWTEITEATTYHLQVDDNSNFSSPIVNDSTLTVLSYTFSSPLSTGRYYWRVRCSDGSRWSSFTPTWDFVLSILELPVLISPDNGSSVYVARPEFFWHIAQGATRYHLQLDNAPDFASPIYSNLNLTDSTYQLTFNLTAGTYYWRIRASDGVIWSDYTSSYSFSTSAPEPPILISPINGYFGDTDPPTFEWEAPEGGNTYDIEVDDNADFSSPVFLIEGYMGTSITPVSELGENTYYWHVRSEGYFGYSDYSSPFTFTIDYGMTGYQYFPGDANMATGTWPPLVIGGDVTYLVNYFRGAPTAQPCLLDGFWCSADANGDCLVIGSDVTKLVNFFRGIGDVLYCEDFEPMWHSAEDLPVDAPSGWPNCETPPVSSKIINGSSVK